MRIQLKLNTAIDFGNFLKQSNWNFFWNFLRQCGYFFRYFFLFDSIWFWQIFWKFFWDFLLLFSWEFFRKLFRYYLKIFWFFFTVRYLTRNFSSELSWNINSIFLLFLWKIHWEFNSNLLWHIIFKLFKDFLLQIRKSLSTFAVQQLKWKFSCSEALWAN